MTFTAKSALAQALGHAHVVETLAYGFMVIEDIDSFYTEHSLAYRLLV